MRINNNLMAMNSHRQLGVNQTALSKSLEKLSSGQKINRAGDDAAGLAISEKMRAQIRGVTQASRNIQDGVSLIQTAEGAMNEVHAMLQRGRELTIQAANDTNTTQDKQELQKEIDQLFVEIDRIANTTEFNTVKLLNRTESTDDSVSQLIIQGLKTGWLELAEDLITTHYGLTASNRDLPIYIVDGAPGGNLAYVQSSWSGATLVGLAMYIERADFDPSTLPNGTNPYGDMYNDRIIAHEMVHAVMADQMSNYLSLPNWFKEGTAEFIHGADERIKNDVAIHGIASIVAAGAAAIGGGWIGNSQYYSGSYLAIKYLETNLDPADDFADFVASVASVGLDQAIIDHTAYTGTADFQTQFAAGGAAYYASLNIQGVGVDELDTGSIAGNEHEGGAAITAEDIIADPIAVNNNPTAFNIIFPSTTSNVDRFMIQMGANAGQIAYISNVDIRTESMGLVEVDVTDDTDDALNKFDSAIGTVSTKRSMLGALQNRMEYAMRMNDNYAENLQASESRIRDLDMAKEMMSYTKTNILSQAAQAMLAQANQAPQSVVQLLR